MPVKGTGVKWLGDGGVGNLGRADVVRPVTQAGRELAPASAGPPGSASANFSAVLEEARQRVGAQDRNVTLSNHASLRLRERGIVASQRMMERVSQATDLLAARRARESLVVVGQVGFVVNVPNRVVVTAMPLGESEPQVFTNIDSAVWLTKEQDGPDR